MDKDALLSFLQDVKNLAEESVNDIVKINENVVVRNHFCCPLCRGYFYDATTIAECLHTFCKSCIVKHFNQEKSCPVCGTRAHQTTPLVSLRPDRLLQDILHAIVPSVYEEEMALQKTFWGERGLPIPDNPWQTYVHSEETEAAILSQAKSAPTAPSEQPSASATADAEMSQGASTVEIQKPEKESRKCSKEKREPVNYTNPFNYIHLGEAHHYRNDEPLKITVIGKIHRPEFKATPGAVDSAENPKFAYKLDVIKTSERTRLTDLRGLLANMYGSLSQHSTSPADIVLTLVTLDQQMPLLPHSNEKTDKFPFPCKDPKSFDNMTTISMLQTIQLTWNGNPELLIEYGRYDESRYTQSLNVKEEICEKPSEMSTTPTTDAIIPEPAGDGQAMVTS